jgi:chromosome segregation ATPase
VANLEERVNIVEGQSDAHAHAIDRLRIEIAAVRSDMATRGEMASLRTEMASLRTEMASLRTEMADLRRDMVAGDAALRSEIAELRGEMGRRFDVMDQKFMWLAGTQVATLLAVIGVLAGALYR